MDYRPKPGCGQARPLPSSFLLNALHRISLICVSLWLESQKEEGGEKRKHSGFCLLSKTERKGESGSLTCRRCLLGLTGSPHGGWMLSTPGTITGLWEPCFCARRHGQALQWNFRCHAPEMQAHHIGHGCWSCHVHLSLQIHDAWASSVDITGKIANS